MTRDPKWIEVEGDREKVERTREAMRPEVERLTAHLTDERICPTCLRPFKPNDRERRVCALCGQPILKHHKYRFVKSQIQHRNCDDPTSYTTTEGA